MSDMNKTVKHAMIYTIGVFINRMISFIMLPIYTRYMTPADYGTIELLTMTMDIIGIIAGAGLFGAMFRYYYMYNDQKERNVVMSTITILLVLFFLVSSSLGVLFSGDLSSLILDKNDRNTLYFQIMFVCFFFQMFIEIPMMFLRAQQKPVLFVTISIVRLLGQLTLNIYFIVFLEMQIMGVLLSSLIISSTTGIILMIYTFKAVGLSFSRPLAKSMLVFSAPLILSYLGEFILTYSDRYFLKVYAGVSEVGIYSLGYKLGFVLWFFAVKPIFNIWEPQRFEIAEKHGADKINYQVFFFSNILIITIALAITLYSYDFFRLMSSPSFWNAYKVVPLIMIAYIVQAWTVFGNFGLYYSGNTKYMAIGTLGAAVAVVVFSFLLIPTYKSYGAAVATLLAFIVRLVIIYPKAQSYYRLNFPWTKSLLLLVTASVVYIISKQFVIQSIFISITVQTLFLLAFTCLIFILPIFNKIEKKFIYNLIIHPKNALRLLRG